jgi:hypothetical protein
LDEIDSTLTTHSPFHVFSSTKVFPEPKSLLLLRKTGYCEVLQGYLEGLEKLTSEFLFHLPVPSSDQFAATFTD